jgi:hypothetical protein
LGAEHSYQAEEIIEKWELFKELLAVTNKLRSKFIADDSSKKGKPDCLKF